MSYQFCFFFFFVFVFFWGGGSDSTMSWTCAYRTFALQTFFLRLVDLFLQHDERFMLISWYVKMMLLRIENRYFWGLKISEPQSYRYKESQLEELKDPIGQKVAEILPDQTILVNL